MIRAVDDMMTDETGEEQQGYSNQGESGEYEDDTSGEEYESEDDEDEEEEEDDLPPPPPSLKSQYLCGSEENLGKQRLISSFSNRYNQELLLSLDFQPPTKATTEGEEPSNPAPSARTIDEQLIQDLVAIFVVNDIDQDGNINRLQLVAAIEAMGIRPNDRILNWYMKKRSSKKTKLIDLEV